MVSPAEIIQLAQRVTALESKLRKQMVLVDAIIAIRAEISAWMADMTKDYETIRAIAELVGIDNARSISPGDLTPGTPAPIIAGAFQRICRCQGDPQAPTTINPDCPQHGAL